MSVLHDDQPSVILVLDPSECFSCEGILADWLEWRRKHPERFRLVFTRDPTDAEYRRTRLINLRVDGTLHPTSRPSTLHTPLELVLRDGQVVYADSGLVGRPTTRLLQVLRESSLETFLNQAEL